MTPRELLLKAADCQAQISYVNFSGCMRAVLTLDDPNIVYQDFERHIQPAADLMLDNPTPAMATEVMLYRCQRADYSGLDILDSIAVSLNCKMAQQLDTRPTAEEWMRHAAAAQEP